MLSLPMNVLLLLVVVIVGYYLNLKKENYRDLWLIVLLAILGQRVFELPYDMVIIFIWHLLWNGILLGF